MEMYHTKVEDATVKVGNYSVIDWVKNDPMRPYSEVPRDILANITEEQLAESVKKDTTVPLPPVTPGAQKRAYYMLVAIDEFDALGKVAKRTYVNQSELKTMFISTYENGKVKTTSEGPIKPATVKAEDANVSKEK